MSRNFFQRSSLLLWLSIVISFSAWQCKSHVKYGTLDNKSVDQTAANNAINDSIIKPYKIEKDKQMNIVLNTAESDMESGRPESKLGNLITDLSMEIANSYYQPSDGLEIDLCLMNNGGLRTSIPKGPITMGLAFEVMPFENQLVVLTLSSDKIYELFEYVAQKGGDPISHASLGIYKGSPVNILINGQAFESDRNYKVLTTDYLSRGGDKMNFFFEPVNYELVGIKLRDAMIEYFENMASRNKTINAKIDGRIYYEQ